MADFRSEIIDDEVSIAFNDEHGIVYIEQDGDSIEIPIDIAKKLFKKGLEMLSNG